MQYYLAGYSILSAICIVLVMIGMLFLELTVLKASKNLHINMLSCVVAAPMQSVHFLFFPS